MNFADMKRAFLEAFQEVEREKRVGGRVARLADRGVNVSSLGDVRVPFGGVPNGGAPTTVLQLNHSQCREFDGLCTVHVSVKDGALSAFAQAGGQSNNRLIGHVSWTTGLATGKCDLDLTSGGIFTVGGTHGVRIDCEQVSIDEGVALATGGDFVVNATAAWGGQSPPAQSSYMTSVRQNLGAGAAGNVLTIPDGARRMSLVSDTGSNVLTTSLLSTSGAGVLAILEQRLSDPPGVMMPIVAGARRFIMSPTKASKVYAIFEMHI